VPVRVCYVQRGVKGDSIVGLRLVAERSEESWAAPANTSGSLTADTDAAAAWLASKLRGSGSRLDALCLDTEGAMCGWLTSPSDDPEILGALAREFGDTPGHEAHEQRTPLADAAATRDEASVALLGRSAKTPGRRKSPADAAPRRVGVLSVSDVPARLLADALDRRGIEVGIVTTAWHALAAVWDPSARTPSIPNPDAVSDADERLTAVLAADAGGRLLWTWSANGTLLAGGSMRLALDKSPQPETALAEVGRTSSFPAKDQTHRTIVGPREASRLATEWLAWSLELGRAPTRIIAVTPAAPHGREAEHEASLAAFGEALTKACPGASMDLAEDRDPLGTTLTRLAERVDDAPASGTPSAAQPVVGSVPGLASRPTRAHRRFYVAASLAVTALAAAAGAYAWKLRAEAGEARQAAARAVESWRSAVREIDGKLLENVEAVGDKLTKQLADLERKLATPSRNRAEIRPILDELATLGMIVGDPEVHLVEFMLESANGATIKVHATLEEATALEQAFRDIAGSNLGEWASTSNPIPRVQGQTQGEGFEYTFRGRWQAPDAAKPAAPKPAAAPAAAPAPTPAANTPTPPKPESASNAGGAT
jgi:hypothetical protein